MNNWTRDQKIAATALAIGVASLVAALLVVPEFRHAMKLDPKEDSQRSAETTKAGSDQSTTRNIPPADPRPNSSLTPSMSASGNTQKRPASKPEPRCSEEGRYKSELTFDHVNVIVANVSPKAIKVFWINYDGQRALPADILPQHMTTLQTYANHLFVIADENGTCEKVFVVRPDLTQVVYK